MKMSCRLGSIISKRGVAFVDSQSGKHYEARGKAVVVAASTLESARLLLLSKSNVHPNGIGNSSGHVGHNFCEHLMGPGVNGLVKDLVGKPRTLDDGRMVEVIQRGEPATFPLNGVIKCWTEGVQLMYEGEKTRFWIPENLAYKGKSAPYGMLVFDVELIKIQ